MLDVAEVTQWCWLKKSGQWLENVDRTHLVQARVKPVLHKKLNCFSIQCLIKSAFATVNIVKNWLVS